MTDNKSSLSIREKVALACSVGVLVAGVIYWSMQVRAVIELLKLAYG